MTDHINPDKEQYAEKVLKIYADRSAKLITLVNENPRHIKTGYYRSEIARLRRFYLVYLRLCGLMYTHLAKVYGCTDSNVRALAISGCRQLTRSEYGFEDRDELYDVFDDPGRTKIQPTDVEIKVHLDFIESMLKRTGLK